ncbi:MAG: hypothetical protein O7B32_02095 [Thaumarchaeota archaeon]|nr:hypothetical protein [Nitrososphaerota archaeon]MCZ6616089.1 hypothetical protein [Nitrososphaerota archaeon]
MDSGRVLPKEMRTIVLVLAVSGVLWVLFGVIQPSSLSLVVPGALSLVSAFAIVKLRNALTRALVYSTLVFSLVLSLNFVVSSLYLLSLGLVIISIAAFVGYSIASVIFIISILTVKANSSIFS